MPSPFPGMDPYLEDPPRWGGLHQRFITCLSDVLNAKLASRYFAEIGERVYLVHPPRGVYPDVETLVQPQVQEPAGVYAAMKESTEQSDPAWVLRSEPEEVREVFVQVSLVGEQEKIVTVVEFLSPGNKASGSEGRKLYLQKQQEVLQSQTHLVEIDLLRAGEHTVAAPREVLHRKGKWNYLVCMHRSNLRWQFEVWAISLRQTLPRIRIPLLHPDPDLVVNLQEILDRCYETGPYARRVDYDREPPIPLNAEDAAWADGLLRKKGLRI